MLWRILTAMRLRCPRCGRGELFPRKRILLDFDFRMHPRCPVCNESFYREPGFYYGAMFISYIASSFFSLALAGACILFLHMPWEWAVFLVAVCLFLGYGYLFKLSRSLWLLLFVRADKTQ